MENANIAVFEDYEPLRTSTIDYIERLGHTVTAQAATLETALETVDAIAKGEIACDAIVLDGNLSHGPKDGSDAASVVARIRELNANVKIIGFSQKEMIEYGVFVDFDTQKNIERLRCALSEL